jgi:hypothetical protein
VIDQLLVQKDFRFLGAVKSAACSADTEELRGAILLQAQSQMERPDEYGQRIGGQILRSLLRGGLFPGISLIRFLIEHPRALRVASRQLFLAIERSYPRNEAIELLRELTAAVTFDAKMVHASLSLLEPPDFLVSGVAFVLKAEPVPPRAILAVLAEWRKAVDLGLTTVARLFDLINGSEALQSESPPQVLDFFLALSKEELETVAHDTISRFVRRVGELSPTQGLLLCKPALEKLPYLYEEIFDFLRDSQTTMYFDEWCRTFPTVLPLLSDKDRNAMIDFLYDLTWCEMTHGHVSLSTTLKMVQRTASSDEGRDAIGSDPDFMFSSHRLTVRGWREIAALLALAPIEPVTLSMMERALNVHAHALVEPFTEILARFPADSVRDWIAGLACGCQQKQIITINLLVALVRVHPTLYPLLVGTVARFVNNERAPQLVRCRAIRAVADVRTNPCAKDCQAEIDGMEQALSRITTIPEMDALAGTGWIPGRKVTESKSLPPKPIVAKTSLRTIRAVHTPKLGRKPMNIFVGKAGGVSLTVQ